MLIARLQGACNMFVELLAQKFEDDFYIIL